MRCVDRIDLWFIAGGDKSLQLLLFLYPNLGVSNIIKYKPGYRPTVPSRIVRRRCCGV